MTGRPITGPLQNRLRDAFPRLDVARHPQLAIAKASRIRRQPAYAGVDHEELTHARAVVDLLPPVGSESFPVSNDIPSDKGAIILVERSANGEFHLDGVTHDARGQFPIFSYRSDRECGVRVESVSRRFPRGAVGSHALPDSWHGVVVVGPDHFGTRWQIRELRGH